MPQTLSDCRFRRLRLAMTHSNLARKTVLLNVPTLNCVACFMATRRGEEHFLWRPSITDGCYGDAGLL